MVHSLKEAETRETLRRCHANQQREALLPAAWTKPPANSYNVFLLFNLEAAWDEGHCILALGPVGGPLQTYSYYRHSSQLEAPGIMADLKEPMTFAELQERSGWIVHGQPGNWWNEHVSCAIALWCDEVTFRAVQACAEDRRAHTGTYNLITYNCLTFCDEALAAGGIQHLRPVGTDEVIRLYPLQHRGVQGMARPAGGQRHQHSPLLRLLQRVPHGSRGGKAAFFYQGSIHIQSNQTNFGHRFLPKSLSL